jgi:hypothetical protein
MRIRLVGYSFHADLNEFVFRSGSNNNGFDPEGSNKVLWIRITLMRIRMPIHVDADPDANPAFFTVLIRPEW